MKFKDFWANINSLPRTKKSKKKQKTSQPVFDYVTLKSPQTPPEQQELNGNVEKQSHGVKANKSLVADDFTYFDDRRYLNNVNNTNNNAEVDNFNLLKPGKTNCACYKHIGTYCTLPVDRSGKPRDPNRVVLDNETRLTLQHYGDNLYATVPKNRSRIRTNPWLASPDSMSPASSITSGSPANSPTNQKPFTEETMRKGSINSDTCSQSSANTDCKKRKCDFEPNSPDKDRTLTRKSHPMTSTMETSVTSTCSNTTSGIDTGYDYESPMATSTDSFTSGQYEYQHSAARPKHLDIGDKQSTNRSTRELTPSFEDSFEYEETLESALDDSLPDDTTPCNSDNDGDDEGVNYNDLDKMCKSKQKELTIPQNIIQKDQCVTESSPIDSLEHSPISKCNQGYHTLDTAMLKLRRAEKMRDGQTSTPSGRSIDEIRESLEDKVTRLRREKWVVQEKIKQAKEEERIRIQEKLKFQRQVTLQRKEMLLKTIQDLREKLDNQSYRLQVSYNHVLFMQRQESRQRILGDKLIRESSLRPMPVHHDLIKESPF